MDHNHKKYTDYNYKKDMIRLMFEEIEKDNIKKLFKKLSGFIEQNPLVVNNKLFLFDTLSFEILDILSKITKINREHISYEYENNYIINDPRFISMADLSNNSKWTKFISMLVVLTNNVKKNNINNLIDNIYNKFDVIEKSVFYLLEVMQYMNIETKNVGKFNIRNIKNIESINVTNNSFENKILNILKANRLFLTIMECTDDQIINLILIKLNLDYTHTINVKTALVNLSKKNKVTIRYTDYSKRKFSQEFWKEYFKITNNGLNEFKLNSTNIRELEAQIFREFPFINNGPKITAEQYMAYSNEYKNTIKYIPPREPYSIYHTEEYWDKYYEYLEKTPGEVLRYKEKINIYNEIILKNPRIDNNTSKRITNNEYIKLKKKK
jgi:hypothetical protein